MVFEDTWHWTTESEDVYTELLHTSSEIASTITGIRDAIKENDMMAYLVMMAIRLVELRRVLKNTGSLYLHCDPVASHYLKLILDAIFGPTNFRNEIVWERVRGLSATSRNFRKAHDVILRYSKTKNYVFFNQYKEKDDNYEKQFKEKDKDDNFYTRAKLLGPGKVKNGETGKIWRGVDPNNHGKQGSHWIYKIEKLEELDREGKIVWPKKKGGTPRLKYYLDESPGIKVTDVWTDIYPIESNSSESMGYQTQKPVALLKRILEASSKEGDMILDPFCGCGTAIHAAEKIKREWTGIDVSPIAIRLVEKRMKDAFKITVKVTGTPTSLDSALDLADRNRLQFETWAATLIPNVIPNKKQVGDSGIDGVGYIHLGKDKNGKRIDAKIVVSVKSGEDPNPSKVRDLVGAMSSEKADLAVFICIKKPTRDMIKAAAKAGLFETPLDQKYPKLQIYTIGDYFNRIPPKLPSLEDFFKAPRSKTEPGGTQATL